MIHKTNNLTLNRSININTNELLNICDIKNEDEQFYVLSLLQRKECVNYLK